MKRFIRYALNKDIAIDGVRLYLQC